MNAQERQEWAQMERRIAYLERVLAGFPARFAGGGKPHVYTVSIIGGNMLSSGQQGVKSVSSLTSVPVKYDPTIDTSFIDGVGYGLLGIDGVYDGTKVLVVNNGGGLTFNSFPLIANNVIITSGPIAIPVGAGPDSVDCYTLG